MVIDTPILLDNNKLSHYSIKSFSSNGSQYLQFEDTICGTRRSMQIHISIFTMSNVAKHFISSVTTILFTYYYLTKQL